MRDSVYKIGESYYDKCDKCKQDYPTKSMTCNGMLLMGNRVKLILCPTCQQKFREIIGGQPLYQITRIDALRGWLK